MASNSNSKRNSSKSAVTSSVVTVHVPVKGSIDHVVLEIVAALNDLQSVQFIDNDTHTNDTTTTNDSAVPSASMELYSTFTSLSQHAVATGLAGSVRLLCGNGNLLAGANDIATATVASWMQAVEQALLPMVRQPEDDSGNAALFKDTLQDFLQKMDHHLFQNDQTWLTGDTATVADVVVACVTAAAVHKSRTTSAATKTKTKDTATAAAAALSVPAQTYRWLQTVYALIDKCCGGIETAALAVHTVEQWMQHVTAAAAHVVASPTEKPVQVGAAAAAAVVFVAPNQKEEKATAAAATTPKAAAIKETPAPTPTKAVPTTTTATDTDTGDNPVLQLLATHMDHTDYSVYSHAPCMTAEELVANVPLLVGTDSHTKNLFLKDKKHGLFLITVSTNSAVHTKELGQLLKLPGKTNLRMADPAVLDSVLHVLPGCVGPLCMGLIDKAVTTENITLVLDKALLNASHIHSHPARNDQSVIMTPVALQAFLTKVGVEPVVLEFADAATAGAATEVLPGKVPANRPPATKTPKQKADKPFDGAVPAPPTVNKDKKTAKKGETLLALQWKKEENFAMWYTDVIVLSEMISYYDISGCYILRPWSYKMWELIQEWFNVKIEAMGVENAYFPLFVSQERLEKEKDHVEGFAPEVAWVTRSGEGELAKPIAVRPTSETIMYPAYSDWIKSHRDLPLKLNQWSNVVRWEFKYPTPFLRTREFLWQEGHTAHSTFKEADETVMEALELYRAVYEDLLAVPVVKGYKTEKEKFAGGYSTTTVEAYIAGSGRAIQGATSHNLGQNFGKMFDIKFQDEKGNTEIAWQTSWGLTTRTIGVMVMVHGDDTGLVLPPAIAPLQVVIVPIVSKKLTDEAARPYCADILADLKSNGIRAKYDDRNMYNPGWKYNHWEQKGVPVRVEVGPRDIEQKSVRVVIRHDGHKEDFQVDGLGAMLKAKLVEIQATMFTKAKIARDSHVVKVTEWKDFVPELENNNLVLTPWCGGEHQDWEEWVKKTSREESLLARGAEEEDEKTATSVAAKTLCIPFDQPELPAGTKCIASGMAAKCWVLWGRSY